MGLSLSGGLLLADDERKVSLSSQVEVLKGFKRECPSSKTVDHPGRPCRWECARKFGLIPQSDRDVLASQMFITVSPSLCLYQSSVAVERRRSYFSRILPSSEEELGENTAFRTASCWLKRGKSAFVNTDVLASILKDTIWAVNKLL